MRISSEVIGILIVAIFWGCYPLVSRSAGIGNSVATLVMMSAGWLVIVAAAAWQGFDARPSGSALVKLTIAGAMMGVGMLAFNAVATSRSMDASVSIPIMDTSMLIVTVIAAVMFFAEPITLKKVIGIALLLAGIATLHRP